MASIVYGDTEQWEVDATGCVVRRLIDASYKKALMLGEVIPIYEENDSQTGYNYQIQRIEKSDVENKSKLLLLRKGKLRNKKAR